MKITKHTGPIPDALQTRMTAYRTKYQPILDAIHGIAVGETTRVEFGSIEDRCRARQVLDKMSRSTRPWLRDYTIAGRETALYFTRDA